MAFATLGPTYKVIEIPNTSYDRRSNAPDHAYQDRALVAHTNSLPPTAEIATRFQAACERLIAMCKSDSAGSTFATCLVTQDAEGRKILHTAHAGDSALCILEIQPGHPPNLKLLTSRHKATERIHPPGDFDFGGIRISQALGDRDFQYEGSAFSPKMAMQQIPLTSSPGVRHYLLAFSDGFADFLGVNPDLPEDKYQEQLLQKLSLRIQRILASFSGTGSIFEYCMATLSAQMHAYAEPKSGTDDITLVGALIENNLLVAVADGHGVGEDGTTLEGDATSKKAIALFPALLSEALDTSFSIDHTTPEAWVEAQKRAICIAQSPASTTPMATAAGAVAAPLDLNRVRTLLQNILDKHYISGLDAAPDLSAMQKIISLQFVATPLTPFQDALFALMQLQEHPTEMELLKLERIQKSAVALRALEAALGF